MREGEEMLGKKKCREEGKSVAEGECCELGKCVFESLKEGLHTIHTAETELEHKLKSVLRARTVERLECGIGLACREHTAHDASDMEVHRSVGRLRKQLSQQLRE
jgi:hypothetical protein